MVYLGIMGTTYCIICGGEMRESRLLTCSHECYLQLKFNKEEFKRDIKKKPDSMNALHINIRRKRWQRELSTWNARTPNQLLRTCGFCGKEFTAKTSRSYYC